MFMEVCMFNSKYISKLLVLVLCASTFTSTTHAMRPMSQQLIDIVEDDQPTAMDRREDGDTTESKAVHIPVVATPDTRPVPAGTKRKSSDEPGLDSGVHSAKKNRVYLIAPQKSRVTGEMVPTPHIVRPAAPAPSRAASPAVTSLLSIPAAAHHVPSHAERSGLGLYGITQEEREEQERITKEREIREREINAESAAEQSGFYKRDQEREREEDELKKPKALSTAAEAAPAATSEPEVEIKRAPGARNFIPGIPNDIVINRIMPFLGGTMLEAINAVIIMFNVNNTEALQKILLRGTVFLSGWQKICSSMANTLGTSAEFMDLLSRVQRKFKLFADNQFEMLPAFFVLFDDTNTDTEHCPRKQLINELFVNAIIQHKFAFASFLAKNMGADVDGICRIANEPGRVDSEYSRLDTPLVDFLREKIIININSGRAKLAVQDEQEIIKGLHVLAHLGANFGINNPRRVSECDPYYRLPIDYATDMKSPAIVSVILAHKANINSRNYTGRNALARYTQDLTVIRSDDPIIKALVAAGAENARDHNGRPALRSSTCHRRINSVSMCARVTGVLAGIAGTVLGALYIGGVYVIFWGVDFGI